MNILSGIGFQDFQYIEDKGLDKIREHAYDFVNKRLAPQYIENDGRQTPTKGHPVFISEHATATCCRGCLYKWHKIEKEKGEALGNTALKLEK